METANKTKEEQFRARVKEFAAAKGLSVKALQDLLGLSNAHFANTARITPRVGQKMKDQFPDVNIEWINYGDGEMLLDSSKVQAVSSFKVPLLPVFAIAGKLTEYVAQIQEADCERIISPIRDAQIAMTVQGDSMTPEYPSGSIVLLSKINERAFIEWGKTFVLDTCNGTIIKKIYPSPKDEQKVICRSVNPNYAEFELSMADIYGWYIVRMQMSPK